MLEQGTQIDAIDQIDQVATGQLKQDPALLLMARPLLWELLLFVLVSMAAGNLLLTDLHHQFSEPFRQLLGVPLPSLLLTIALAVYLTTALMQLLLRQLHDRGLAMRCFHFVFRCAFYLFYSFSGALAGHYLFVLGSGLLLYGLEQLNLWLVVGKKSPTQAMVGDP